MDYMNECAGLHVVYSQSSFFLSYAGNTKIVMSLTENKVDLLDALGCH